MKTTEDLGFTPEEIRLLVTGAQTFLAPVLEDGELPIPEGDEPTETTD